MLRASALDMSSFLTCVLFFLPALAGAQHTTAEPPQAFTLRPRVPPSSFQMFGQGAFPSALQLNSDTTRPTSLLQPFELGGKPFVDDVSVAESLNEHFAGVDDAKELLSEAGFESDDDDLNHRLKDLLLRYDNCTRESVQRDAEKQRNRPKGEFSFFGGSSAFLELSVHICVSISDASFNHRYHCDGKSSACRQRSAWGSRAVQSILDSRSRGVLSKLHLLATFGKQAGSHSFAGAGGTIDSKITALKTALRSGLFLAEAKAGNLLWIPAVVCFSLILVAGLVFAIVGLWTKFFKNQWYLFALLVTLVVSVSLQIFFWTVQVTGYQDLGQLTSVPSIPRVAVDVIGRVSVIGFFLLFALFSFLVFVAAQESSGSSSKGLTLFVGITFAAVAVVVAGYAVAMAVVSTVATSSFVLDVSEVLLAAVSLLFAFALSLTFAVVVWKLMASKKTNSKANPCFRELYRNAKWFLVGSVVLVLGFSGRLVITCLWMFHNFQQFETPRMIADCVAAALTSLAILLYLFPVLRSKRNRVVVETEGYALWDSSNGIVPLKYQGY